MTDGTSTIEQRRADAFDGRPPWFSWPAGDVVAALGSDTAGGLSRGEAATRLGRYGPNRIAAEKPPSAWTVALRQLRDPMNIMLVVVVAISALLGEASTAIIVGLLVLLNVVLGARQELNAQASVDALAKMQVPEAKVVGDGELAVMPAVELVPGDIAHLEAGDLVPADGRIVRSASLETQEAALTGESAPVTKDAGVLPAGDVALGDRSNMLFQNTSVTRGTVTMVVTATGMQTQMGDDADRGEADPVAPAERARLPHQGPRRHRLDRGRVHRGGGRASRHGVRPAPAAGHRDGHLGHPHRTAGVSSPHCSRTARRISRGRRPSSRTSPTSRRWARRAPSTPTRRAP
jgi:hypothetical protein